MPDVDRRQLLVLAALAVVVAGLGLRLLGGGGSPPAPAPQAVTPAVRVERTTQRVTVHVAGAVRRPGLYRLRAGSRVDDAVRRSGGPLRGADLDALNLAAEVEDGRQVLVPERGAAPPAAPTAGGGAAAGGQVVVNLNTATPEELDTLDGIGPALAAAIVAHREEHGGFGSVAELSEVPGIGDARMAALEGRVGV